MTLVQSTAHSAIHSKSSMYQMNYTTDEPLVKFNLKRSPTINMGYYIRHALLRAMVPSQCDVVINLGCGLEDPKSFHITCLKWIDIDLKSIIDDKKSLIGEYDFEYVLIEGDITNYKQIIDILKTHVASYHSVCFIAECVFVYCNPRKIDDLLYHINTIDCKSIQMIIYEQTIRNNQFQTQMLSHFKQIAPLKGHLSIEGHKKRYSLFKNCSVQTLYDLLFLLDLDKLDSEPFDEYEAFIDYLLQYVIINVTNYGKDSNTVNLTSNTQLSLPLIESEGKTTFKGTRGVKINDKLYIIDQMSGVLSINGFKGPKSRIHYAYCVNQNSIYIYGGRNNPRKPFNDFYEFNTLTNEWTTLNSPDSIGMYRAQLLSINNSLILLGSTCYQYSFQTSKWTTLKLEIPFHGFAATVHNNKLFIHGGISNWVLNSDLYSVNLDTLTLDFIKTLCLRMGHHLIVNDQFIAIMGGSGSEGDISLYTMTKIYNFRLDSIYLVNCSILLDKELHIIGGLETCFSFSSHHNPLTSTFIHPLMHIRYPFTYNLARNEDLFHFENLQKLDFQVSVHISEENQLQFVNKNFIYKVMNFNEFLMLIKESNCYLRTLHPKKPFKKPVDIRDMDYFTSFQPSLPQNIITESIYSIPLRLSSKNLKLWGHYDALDNILIQYEGIKRVILVPPSSYNRLEMAGTCSALKWTMTSLKDMVHYEFILNKNDHLYIPSGWIHFVESLESSVGVNIFYKHLENDKFTTDAYSGGDLKNFTVAMKKMDDIKQLLATSGADEELLKMYTDRLVSKLVKSE